MSAEWLDKIAGMLDNSMGKNAQRQAAYDAATQMDALLPYGTRNADLFAQLLRKMFETWIHGMHYLRPVEALDHRLPETMMRSDLEVASEYGLTSEKSIHAKQEWLERARSMRVQRCVAHLEAGWPPEDCISFICARDEWEQARRKARAAA